MERMTVEQEHAAFRALTRDDSTPEEIEARISLMQHLATLRAELDGMRAMLREVSAVGITMLYDSHKEDVLAEFSLEELEAVVGVAALLGASKVEKIYHKAFDAARQEKGHE